MMSMKAVNISLGLGKVGVLALLRNSLHLWPPCLIQGELSECLEAVRNWGGAGPEKAPQPFPYILNI